MYSWVQRNVGSLKAGAAASGSAKSAKEREAGILKAVPFEIQYRCSSDLYSKRVSCDHWHA